MRKVVKQLRHGQITIPKELREAIGLDGDDMLSITVNGDKLEVEPVKVASKRKGSPWAKELYELFAPVRESLEGHSEEEINEAIDEALREVREKKE
jgi:AbrB family looped-hinge helix DNA binding protein